MIVYSNTTPFIALASIGRLELLPKIFGKVHVAEAVIEECAEGGRILVGRRTAEYLGLNVTGTLGVLAKAKTLGLIDSFRDAALAMQQQGIYYNTPLIQRLAQHLGE